MAINLSIKAVPDELAALLRERARRHHRSLQGELLAIIEAAVVAIHPEDVSAVASGPARGEVVGFARNGRPIVRKGTRSVEEIAADARRIWPVPRHDLPRSVDIIRKMRDSR